MTSEPPLLSGNSTFMSETLSGAATRNTSEKPTTEWMEQYYIPFDIQLTHEISLDDFIEPFGADPNDLVERNAEIERIASDHRIQALRNVYCKAASRSKDERDRYGPLEELSDVMLNNLFKNQHGPSIRNDPHYLRGARETITKPGVVFELLYPIIELDSLEDFKECFRDIFQGHHFLWTLGIQHRDISPANLMYRRLPDNRIQGVLNDWDLANLANSDARSSRSRTGTRPFMAQDILVVEPPIHIERYDWESQLYVLIWVGSRYGRGGEILCKKALSGWLDYDFNRLFGGKARIFQKGCPPLTEYYGDLKKWINSMIKLFTWGHAALRDYEAERDEDPNSMDDSQPFDHLSLGGHVTYTKLQEIYWS